MQTNENPLQRPRIGPTVRDALQAIRLIVRRRDNALDALAMLRMAGRIEIEDSVFEVLT